MVAKPSFRAGLSTRDARSPRRLVRRGRAAIVLIATAMGFLTFAGTSLASTTPVFFDANGNVGAGPSPFNGTYSGSDNVVLGDTMMPALTSGSDNIASGFQALLANTSGSDNIAIGSNALRSNSAGAHNIAT